jgi:hypothetical protein
LHRAWGWTSANDDDADAGFVVHHPHEERAGGVAESVREDDDVFCLEWRPAVSRRRVVGPENREASTRIADSYAVEDGVGDVVALRRGKIVPMYACGPKNSCNPGIS